MRNIIIGIVIGTVFGVMAGASVITPGLNQARHTPPSTAPGVESLALDTPSQPQSGAKASSNSKQKQRLRIISLLPIKSSLFGDITHHLEQNLTVSSTGKLGATLYAPDTLVPTEETFAAVKSGTVEAAYAFPDQWDQASPTLQLFSAVPFGPKATEFLAWFYHGGGQVLFEDQFKRQGVHAVLCGALPPAGSGWFKKQLYSIEDIKGLNIRSRGLGAHVLQKLGANIKDFKPAAILNALKEGQLDGAEYTLPSVDGQMGFGQFARHYYFPGWQQPVSLLALIINAKTWNGLAENDQTVIEKSCGDTVRFSLVRADADQFNALKKLSLAGVQVHRWPTPILDTFKAQWTQTARDLVQQDADFKAAWSSLHLFRQDYEIWREISRP